MGLYLYLQHDLQLMHRTLAIGEPNPPPDMASIRGIAYRLHMEDGQLVTHEDFDLLRDHIISVLETEPYERVMRPGYGTPDLLLRGVTDINLIAQRVRQSLEREIPDVLFAVLGRIADDGAGVLVVRWAVDGQPQPPLEFKLAS